MPLQKSNKKKSALREWIESFLIAAIIATFVRTLFFQMYRIPTESMVPVLLPGDKVFVDRLRYGTRIPLTNIHLDGFKQLQRGDIVVFVPPQEAALPWYKRKQFIKRLIGLPGEHVAIKGGDIYVNGQLIADPLIAKNYYRSDPQFGEYGTADKEVLVPPGKYFFLGDNSANSKDSRDWGFADKQWVVGRALFIWWPPQRIGKIY